MIRVNEEHKYLLAKHGIDGRVMKPVNYSTFVKLFLQHKQGQGRTHSTIEAYRYGLNNFGESLKRDPWVHKITIDMLETFAA